MTTENQTNEATPDIWDMSDDDFAKLDLGSLDQVASDEDDEATESTESEQTQQPDTSEDEDEYHEDERSESEVDTESEDEAEEEQEQEEAEVETEEEEAEAESKVDYAAEYKRLIGTPIKANGKDITIDSVDDAIKLIQMGANYYKKVEQLKPAQKIVSMLEKAQLLDESKLSFAIDLLNKDPAAIQSLVADMDMSDVLDEKHTGYTPKDHSVSDVQLNLDNVINDVASTPTGHITLKVLGEQWDQASRHIVVSNPNIITLINQHVSDGTFDTVTREVEKRRMLGQIPQGLNDIEAYKFVGDQLYANGSSTTAPKGQQQVAANANAKPIVKPSKETVVNKKRAASNTARNSSQSVSQNMDDVFAMSDEEFKAKYGKF